MIELGKVQELEVVRIKEFGVYLSESAKEGASVLLPKKQVPEGTRIGDKITVFIYKDSEDRLIATVGIPKLQVGETAVLEVKETSKIGAFLDMGWPATATSARATCVFFAVFAIVVMYAVSIFLSIRIMKNKEM